MDNGQPVNLRNLNNLRSPNTPNIPKHPNLEQGNSEPTEVKKFSTKIFDRLIGLSIFMLFFGLPLYFTGLAKQGVIFEKQMYFYFFLLFGLIVWAARGVTLGEMNIRRTPLDIPILGLWLTAIAATIFSVDRWHSFWGAFGDPSRGLMSLTAYAIAFYFVSSNFSAKRLKMAFVAIMSSGAVVGLWTLFAILGAKFLPDPLAAYAPLSLLGSMTGLGIFFSVLVPVIMVAILKIGENEALTKLKKNLALSATLLLLALDLFLILSLYNYVPWLGFFIGIVVFLIFILAKIMRPASGWVWLPMVVFVLVMMLRMTGTVNISRINLPVEVSLNAKTTFSIAKESLKDRFLIGSGPATYSYNFSLHKPQAFNLNSLYNLRFYQGTGVLSETASTLGAIGIFFLLILVLTYVGTQFYLLSRQKEKNKIYSLGVFSAASILLIDVLLTRVDGAVLGLAVMFFTLAFSTLLLESPESGKMIKLSLKASPKFALTLAFVFMAICAGVAYLFVYIGKVYAADVYAGSSARTIAKNEEKALTSLGKAVKFNQREAAYYIQAGQYYMSLANREAMKGEDARDLNKIQGYLNASIASAKIAKNMSNNDVSTVESLAVIYENAGLYVADSLSLAKENYERAQELEPHNPVYDIKLGQLKVAEAGKKKAADEKKQAVREAKDFFQKAVDEKNNYADAYYQLSLASEALEDLDGGIENIGKAIALNQQNANYLLVAGRMYQARGKEDDIKIAEQAYKGVVALNDKNINGHLYLGLFYEKNKNKDGAKAEYQKIVDLVQTNSNGKNEELVAQLRKMIGNVERGVANTPESLGLIKAADSNQAAGNNPEVSPNELAPGETVSPAPTENISAPANTAGPTIEEVQQ